MCIMMIHEEDNESECMYGHATVMERVKLYNMNRNGSDDTSRDGTGALIEQEAWLQH